MPPLRMPPRDALRPPPGRRGGGAAPGGRIVVAAPHRGGRRPRRSGADRGGRRPRFRRPGRPPSGRVNGKNCKPRPDHPGRIARGRRGEIVTTPPGGRSALSPLSPPTLWEIEQTFGRFRPDRVGVGWGLLRNHSSQNFQRSRFRSFFVSLRGAAKGGAPHPTRCPASCRATRSLYGAATVLQSPHSANVSGSQSEYSAPAPASARALYSRSRHCHPSGP